MSKSALISSLRPEVDSLDLTVKVLSSRVVLDKPRTDRLPPLKVVEGLVGDASGVIMISLRCASEPKHL